MSDVGGGTPPGFLDDLDPIGDAVPSDSADVRALRCEGSFVRYRNRVQTCTQPPQRIGRALVGQFPKDTQATTLIQVAA